VWQVDWIPPKHSKQTSFCKNWVPTSARPAHHFDTHSAVFGMSFILDSDFLTATEAAVMPDHRPATQTWRHFSSVKFLALDLFRVFQVLHRQMRFSISANGRAATKWHLSYSILRHSLSRTEPLSQRILPTPCR